MKSHRKRVPVLLAGWGFLAFGAVGMILPVLHGTVFVLIGLIILSSQYAWARLLVVKLRKRFPKLGRTADAATAKVKSWLHGVGREKVTG